MLIGLALIGLGAYIEWEIRNQTGWQGFFNWMAHVFYLGDIRENRDRAIAMLIGGPLLFILGFAYWRVLILWDNRRRQQSGDMAPTRATIPAMNRPRKRS